MSNVLISPDKLIEKFQQALNEGWGYIYGATGGTWTQAKQNASTREQTVKWGSRWIGKRVADCSGLFCWAFHELGGYMYHGSNTMYNKYSDAKGKLKDGKRTDGKELLPGSAVYKYDNSTQWHHVGLYIGNGTVIEAKGTYYGVVTSKVEAWHYWSELKGVNYSNTEVVPLTGKCTVSGSGTVRLRKKASTSGAIIYNVPCGSEVTVVSDEGAWAKVQYTLDGYMMTKFLQGVNTDGKSNDG